MYSIEIFYRGATNEPEMYENVTSYDIYYGFLILEFEEWPIVYINSVLIDHFQVFSEED